MMRRVVWGGAVSASVMMIIIASGCGSSSGDRAGFDTDPTNPSNGGGAGSSGGALASDASASGLADSAFEGCASSTNEAKSLPAAMLFVLDKSGTMAEAGKYGSAQTAIVSAMDEAAFDSMSLGLLGYPTANMTGPACVFGLPVLCGVSALPQVPLALAGADKSSAQNGVRHAMYQWLASNAPQPGNGDANPTYDALTSGINALKAWQPGSNASANAGVRILFYITDGGASCASLSSRPGYVDGNQCNDWEYPSTIVSLVKSAHDDDANANAKVNTIVVGVPGASTHGENANVPPYSVRLALSAYAAAGSPETIPTGCSGTAFTQAGGDPQSACHFDMTTPNSYSSSALASAIGQVRGSLLGCTFELPKATNQNAPVDKSQVNVHVDGSAGASDLYKRKDASNSCATDGCWDYDASGNVVLLGKACEDVKSDVKAKVQIVVGCATLVK